MTQLSGTAAGITLTVIVRVLAELRLTGRLQVSQDGWTGDVAFDQGQIVAVEFGTERGWPALEAILLALPEGQCSFSPEAPTAEPNSALSLEALEARLDQVAQRRARLASRVPSLTAVPRMREPRDWRSGADVTLPRSALSTFMAIDGRRSVGELCLGHGLVRTLTDLATLVDLGLIDMEVPTSQAPPVAASTSTPAIGQRKHPELDAIDIPTSDSPLEYEAQHEPSSVAQPPIDRCHVPLG
jgi:Domain of unknown function (DUF4388)